MPTPLETELTALVAGMPSLTALDRIQRARAQELVTEYIAAKAALQAAAGNDLVSYSRVGFSATKLPADKFRAYVREIETDLREAVFGCTTLIDNSARPEGSGPV